MNPSPRPEKGDSANKAPRKVLMVAFDFPPKRTSGVYRPSALTKYLPQFGWQPTVLTVEERKGETADSTLTQRIPAHLHVARTRYFRVDGWEHSTANALRASGALSTTAKDPRESLKDKIVRALGRWLRAFLYFPDRAVGWIPSGLMKAIELHRKEKFDVIYTSSNPFSSAVIGLFLKRLFNGRWILEFRDPWILPEHLRAALGNAAPLPRRVLERILYKIVLRHVDLVVAVTKGHCEELQNLDRVPANKIAVVTNGFDEDDFGKEDSAQSSLLAPGYLHLTHFGDIYPGFSGQFFPALAELVRESPEMAQRLRINIVGFPDEVTREYAASNELREIIRLHGFVPHDVALQAMRSTDWLLLFYGDEHISRVCIPGKLYEYLRIGRPILAVAHEGGAKELIERGKAGFVLFPENVESIKKSLRGLLTDSGRNGSRGPAQAEFVAQFRYDHLANHLAGVLEEVRRDAR